MHKVHLSRNTKDDWEKRDRGRESSSFWDVGEAHTENPPREKIRTLLLTWGCHKVGEVWREWGVIKDDSNRPRMMKNLK